MYPTIADDPVNRYICQGTTMKVIMDPKKETSCPKKSRR